MAPDRIAWYQAAFGAHYPLLYRHRDVDEARRCLALLPSLAPLYHTPEERVLDLGCGDGRHLQWLTEAGANATGLDLSSQLLAAAAGRASPGHLALVRGDMRWLPLRSGRFSSVLSLFTAFGYFGPPGDNEIVCHEISRVLQPGGHWFLDYFDGDTVRAELGDGVARTRERDLDCLRVKETRSFLAATSQVVKDVELIPVPGAAAAAAAVGVPPMGLRYREQVAVFSLEELDTIADRSGMRRVAAAGDYDGRALGTGSRWILVYQRGGERQS